MGIHAAIATHVRVDVSAMPAELVRAITSTLTIRNAERDRAMRELVRGAEHMPKYIDLWTADGSTLILPRGFVHEFEQFARNLGLEITWETRMIYFADKPCFRELAPISLRDHQAPAADEIEKFCSGLYKAPTAAGKTRVMLEVARRCGQPTIVIVEKTDLVDQWTEAAQALGFEPGYIGGGEWTEKELTIAIRPSLWNRVDEMKRDRWFDRFGMVIVDEVHHASAPTYWELIQCFAAFFRLGPSATPERDDESFARAKAIFGPIIFETSAADVGEHLITPTVRVLRSRFTFDYEPTVIVSRKRQGNNYNEMMDALQVDEDRNDMIINEALNEALDGHAVLIDTRRREHILAMCERLELEMARRDVSIPFFSLTSANSSGARALAAAIDKLPGSILFSTMAQEGTDIPRLDRVILAFPQRKLLGPEQSAGRVMRPHKAKKDAVVVDIFDEKVGLLRGQFRQRRQNLWEIRGYTVTFDNERTAAWAG